MIETIGSDVYDDMVPPMERGRLTVLRWWDVLMITIIMFGEAIWSSTSVFLNSSALIGGSFSEVLSELPEFSPLDDLTSFISQSFLLVAVLLYLRLRRFDFSSWRFRFTWKGTLVGAGLFVAYGLLLDLGFLTVYGPVVVREMFFRHGIFGVLFDSSLMLILYSFLNGFYEELFFLGICAHTDERYRWGYFIFSILVRISFHTYQGIVAAVGIGLILGCINWYAYTRRSRNIWPFMFAHALADIAGLSIFMLI